MGCSTNHQCHLALSAGSYLMYSDNCANSDMTSQAFDRKGGAPKPGSQAAKTATTAQFIKDQVWALVIMDEVQVTPARTFRAIMTSIKVHCKLGLTATLVREDGKIKDLYVNIIDLH